MDSLLRVGQAVAGALSLYCALNGGWDLAISGLILLAQLEIIHKISWFTDV